MPTNKVTAKLVENVRSTITNSRTHEITCDLPPAKGGTDKGPTAYELAIMALADCAVTIFADVAKQSKIDVTNVEVTAEVEKPADSPTPTSAKMIVNISAKAREGLLKAAWRRTEAKCPVVQIFKESIPVEVELNLKAEE